MYKVDRLGLPILSLLILLLILAFRGRDLSASALLNLGLVDLGYSTHSDLIGRQIDGQTQTAERLLSAASRLSPHTSAKRILGQLYLAQDKKVRAAETLGAAGLSSEEALIYGHHAQELRDFQAAEVWYEAAAALDFAQAADSLGRLYQALGNHEHAIRVWGKALQEYPQHSQRLSWWQGMAQSQETRRQWSQLLTTTQLALIENPEDPALLTWQGEAFYHGNGDFSIAENLIKQALSRDDTFAPAYAAMAQIMAQEEQYEAATEWYSRALDHDPEVRWWHVARANAARQQGDLPRAQELYQQTIVNFPDYAPAYFELSKLLEQNGSPHLASITVEQAINLHSSPPVNYYLRAIQLYQLQDRLQDAQRIYQRAVLVYPNDRRLIDMANQLQQKGNG